jgi:tetratricopeptide (TPR) repeat protein
VGERNETSCRMNQGAETLAAATGRQHAGHRLSAASTSTPSAGFPRWLPPLCLVAAVLLAYANALRTPFIFDDAVAIVDNPTIRTLWPPWVALNPPHHGADGGLTVSGRPVLNLSFALNFAISGTQVWSYHAVNLLIHACAALLLFGIMRRTFQQPSLRARFGEAATPLAFVIALLWALHPLQTAAVTYVAQRAESLCGLFYLLTLYSFLRGAKPGASRRWFMLSFAACLLGMGTKEVMVTAPVIVLLYDRTFLAGSFRDAWRMRGRRYLVLASTWLLLGALVASTGGRGGSAGLAGAVPSWDYALTQAWALVRYVALAVWPSGLVFDYGTPLVRSPVSVAPQLLVVAALVTGTLFGLWRQRPLGFAGAWLLAILAPTTSVVAVATQTVAEHRMYLPLAAVVSVAAVAAHRCLGSRGAWVLGAVAVGFGGITVLRNHVYRDAFTIWTDTVAGAPASARAHNNLALELQQRGQFAEADAQFARAVSLQPDYVTAHYDWGVMLLAQGRAADAAGQLETAVRLAPNHADAHVNLGNALVRMQRAAEAIPHYEEALRLNPAADVHFNLGIALLAAGRPDGAAAHLRAALALNPDLSEAHYQLGLIAEQAGRLVDAEKDYTDILRFAPDHLGAHRKLGLLLARRGQLAPAAEHFRAIIRLQPADADAHANLGNVLLLQGQPRAAIAEYETALRLRPDDLRARENLQLAREALH